eukprot:m.120420 g.120420  ORF g.120420 m.120420 type:complete len:74 (+) comp9577_c0_seq1:171-392(+)
MPCCSCFTVPYKRKVDDVFPPVDNDGLNQGLLGILSSGGRVCVVGVASEDSLMAEERLLWRALTAVLQLPCSS